MTWGLRIYTCFVDIVSFRAKKREKTAKNPTEGSHIESDKFHMTGECFSKTSVCEPVNLTTHIIHH